MLPRMAVVFAAAVFIALGTPSAQAADPERLPSIEAAKRAVDDASALAEVNAAKVAGANVLFPKAADRRMAIAEHLARLPYGKEFAPEFDLNAQGAGDVLEAKRAFWEKARYVMACTRGRIRGGLDDGECADVPVSAGGGEAESSDLHKRIMLILDIQEDIVQDKKEISAFRPKQDTMRERKEKLFQQLEARRALYK